MAFGRILRLVLFSTVCISYVMCQCSFEKLKDAHIFPDIIDEIPGELQVFYASKPVECGEELQHIVTDFPPTLNYSATNSEFYTLIMIDPDAPDPHRPVYAQFLHWMTVNIPGTKISEGRDLMKYMPPSPPPHSGAHRYILLVYKQPFHMYSLFHSDGERRHRFNMTHIVSQLGLHGPIAGNFFYVRN